ncbi:hypothetical protein IVB69_08350 [Flavobacterium sp. J49]|uniref:hypothetical protein n=1 Tax=Flavobacterium sp. J49 TaxID=2718534 RepID=UPI0015943085|nr:hypothetical protein [Flavobacterium sp. J49]MBF6641489.1 hypothetical protein [Flavobacterium sp. J49]NIC02736.1 MFS transporter [Flavobacterium sp. J49]
MKLNAEQVERLYTFTRQHYVEYYDLQTELVDHLANAIEEQWVENPKLSFEEALKIEFKKFGVFGFMEVVEKRQAALNKKYNKLVLNELKTFFSIPKIIGTLSATGIVFYLLKSFQEGILIMQTIFLFLVVLYFVGMTLLWKANKRRSQKSGRKWLFKEIIFGYSASAGLINLPLQFSIHLKAENYPDWVLAIYTLFMIVFVLTEYIVLVLIPSKAEKHLKETYPEYEFVK